MGTGDSERRYWLACPVFMLSGEQSLSLADTAHTPLVIPAVFSFCVAARAWNIWWSLAAAAALMVVPLVVVLVAC